MWGYHIANNLSRIMSVEGTVYFPEFTGAIQPEPRIADVTVANLGLTFAPVIQFSSVGPFITATTYVVSHESDLRLMVDIRDETQTFFAYGGPFKAPVGPNMPVDIKLGNTNNEVLGCVYTYAEGLIRDKLLQYNFVIKERGKYSTQKENIDVSETTDPIVNVRIVDSATPTILTREEYHSINPPWVEGYLDQDKLRIRWLHNSAGTVIYKIFGA